MSIAAALAAAPPVAVAKTIPADARRLVVDDLGHRAALVGAAGRIAQDATAGGRSPVACDAAMPPPTWLIESEMTPTEMPAVRPEGARGRAVHRGIALRERRPGAEPEERRDDGAVDASAAAPGSAGGRQNPLDHPLRRAGR